MCATNGPLRSLLTRPPFPGCTSEGVCLVLFCHRCSPGPELVSFQALLLSALTVCLNEESVV